MKDRQAVNKYFSQFVMISKGTEQLPINKCKQILKVSDAESSHHYNNCQKKKIENEYKCIGQWKVSNLNYCKKIFFYYSMQFRNQITSQDTSCSVGETLVV